MIRLKDIFKKEKKYLHIYRYLFRYKGWITLAILFTLLNTLIQVPFPIITKIIVDDVIGKGKTHLILPCILGIIVIIPFMIAIPFIYRVYTFKLTHKTGIMLRKALCERFLRLELAIFQQKGPGYLSSRLFNDVDNLVASIYQVLFPVLQNVLLLLVGLTMVILLNWKLALVPIGFFPIYGYLILHFSKRLKEQNAVLAEKKAVTFEFFTDMMTRIKNIRGHVLETSQLRSFFRKDGDILRQNSKTFITRITLDGLNNLVMILTPALILIFGLNMILNHTLTLGEYIAFNTFMTYMMGPMKFFFSSNITLQDFKVALERVAGAFEWPVSPEYSPAPTVSRIKDCRDASLRLEAVTFSYDNKRDALKNITLTVESGERVVLMGKSGSGKSTLLNLIMGFYPLTSGKISLGYRSYKEIDVVSLRKRIAFVEQEPILFEGNVEDNIILNAPRKQGEPGAVEKAARFANAHEFIIKMEKGYKTDMKRFGSNLSVGQKQRIALGRAFYKDVDIIILDEPTSAIDNQSALLIKEALGKIPPDKTIIMVTHNPVIAEFANRLVVIEEGEIIHDGPPDTIRNHLDLIEEKIVKEINE